MEKTDDELISDYLSGNEPAFKTLTERYIGQIYRFTYRMTGDQSAAEDITQETFVKVWKNLHKYKMTNTFKSLLFTIAKNTTLDHLRKKKIPVFSQFEDSEGKNMLIETLGDPDTLPENLIKKAEQKGLLDECLKIVNPDDREILILHYQDEFTFETIGAILKKPLNTVKSRHRRALAKIRQFLEKNP